MLWSASGASTAYSKNARASIKRKQDLAHIKATWRVFQQISADTKDLNDIPRYWPQAQAFDLPLVEYTAREVRSGLLFWLLPSAVPQPPVPVFAARIQQHLDRCGISLRDLVRQTDNGSEFIGGHDRRRHPTGFPAALGDSQHVRIPPAAHTFQSDVETYRLSEHFMLWLPIGRFVNPLTKVNWENSGVSPDVKVSADKALEVAVALASKKPAGSK